MNGEHHWSGWPGAYCLHCGAEDPIEIALADNTYDLVTDVWESAEVEDQYKYDLWCPGREGQELDCGQCRAYIALKIRVEEDVNIER